MVTSYGDRCSVIDFAKFRDPVTGRAATRKVDVNSVTFRVCMRVCIVWRGREGV